MRLFTASLNRALFIFFALLSISRGGEILNVAGSPVIKRPLADAAQVLSVSNGLEIHFKTNGGSNAGIAALGSGEAQVAMVTRGITSEDRAAWPDINFKAIYLGEQVVAVGVARDVWDGGVHKLTREQFRAIYEGKLKNWKQLNGPDEPIVFFNASEGHGVWELLVQWIYGDSSKVPLVDFPMMKSEEEARDSIEFTRGSIALLSPKLVDGRSVIALGLDSGDGKVHLPEIASLVDGSYPLMKPMYLLVNERPFGAVKILVDFITAPTGRALLDKYGCFGWEELSVKPNP